MTDQMERGLTKLEILRELYGEWNGSAPESLQKLPGSGSSREYYRIRGETLWVLAVWDGGG